MEARKNLPLLKADRLASSTAPRSSFDIFDGLNAKFGDHSLGQCENCSSAPLGVLGR